MLIKLLLEGKRTKKSPKVKLQVKHPGLLEVPEGKNFWELPLSHYKKLVKQYGYSAVSKALTNLEVWNRRKHKDVAEKAKELHDKLDKLYGPESKQKKESVSVDEAKVKIPIKHKHVLEVPDGKDFWQLPLSHYKKLVKEKGYDEISKALTNLEIWNKNRDPQIAEKAKAIRLKLDRLYGPESKKNDSV